MQLKSFLSEWTRIAGLLLIGSALAWAIKLGVIISTNGRIIDTGAAALFMKLGLVLLLVGSTGIGNRISRQRGAWVRTIAILVSPVLLFGSLLLIGTTIGPLFQNSSVWYASQEAPIGIAVVVCLAVGSLLYRSCKTVVA